jgi:hypothetical protein
MIVAPVAVSATAVGLASQGKETCWRTYQLHCRSCFIPASMEQCVNVVASAPEPIARNLVGLIDVGNDLSGESTQKGVRRVSELAPCWKQKNDHVICQAREPMGDAIYEDATKRSYIAAIVEAKYFFEALVGAIVLCVSLFAWWLFTRRAPLRTNILIGLCALGAFIVNAIAGAVIVAAWIISSRLPLLVEKRSAPK